LDFLPAVRQDGQEMSVIRLFLAVRHATDGAAVTVPIACRGANAADVGQPMRACRDYAQLGRKGLPMAGKHARWWTALMVLLGLLVPSNVLAGPYIGDWSWCWHPAPDCPRGEYSWLHYWAPTLYRVRDCVHPSNLDQYPPGPFPPVAPSYEISKYGCRCLPAMPSSPYADPTSYYGRPVAPE
jgi:hypothetical protein